MVTDTKSGLGNTSLKFKKYTGTTFYFLAESLVKKKKKICINMLCQSKHNIIYKPILEMGWPWYQNFKINFRTKYSQL